MPGDRDYLAVMAKGNRLKVLRDSEDFQACFRDVEQNAMETLATTDNPDIAIALWHRIRALRQIGQAVQAPIDDGKLAEQQMKRDGDYQAAKAAEGTTTKRRSRRKTH